MTTQAVSMNLVSGTGGRQLQQQDVSEGFSGFLSDVGSQGRKQAGCSFSESRPTSGSTRGQGPGGTEFGYTQRASGAQSSDEMNVMRGAVRSAANVDTYKADISADEALNTAEEILSEAAAQTVGEIAQNVRSAGIEASKLTKKETMSVMLTVVKRMKQQAQDEDTDKILNALMAILDAMAHGEGNVSFEEFKDAFDLPAQAAAVMSVSMTVSETTEEAAMISERMFAGYGSAERTEDGLGTAADIGEKAPLVQNTTGMPAENEGEKLSESENLPAKGTYTEEALPKAPVTVTDPGETRKIAERQLRPDIDMRQPENPDIQPIDTENTENTEKTEEKPTEDETPAKAGESARTDRPEISAKDDTGRREPVETPRANTAESPAFKDTAQKQADTAAEERPTGETPNNIEEKPKIRLGSQRPAAIAKQARDIPAKAEGPGEAPAEHTENARAAEGEAIAQTVQAETAAKETDTGFTGIAAATDVQTVLTGAGIPAETGAFADSAPQTADRTGSQEQWERSDGFTAEITQNVKELTDILRKELGISEISVRKGEARQEIPADMSGLGSISGKTAGMSVRMNGSDRSGELDHILNGGRFGESETDAPKTETYDAVHMAAELFGDRTQAPIPERTEFFTGTADELRPPEVQTAQEILSRLDDLKSGETEFTMVLNPESLGRITVKMVAMAGGRTAVEINAENPDTARLLSSRTENMQALLRENGVELERYQVVSQNENTDELMRQNYDGSSKNPYSRRETQQSEDEDGEDEDFYDILRSI